MQADPIKPTLRAPGTKSLKLQHDELLSDFAFKFNLHRYTKEGYMRRLLHGRGLHSFPFPLDLSLLCPFPLNLSPLRPPCNPT